MVIDYRILIQFYENNAWTDFPGGITAGSMHLEKAIVKGEIAFGVMYASKFEAQIYAVTENYAGKKIRVVKRKTGENDVNLFTGRVESSNTDYTGVYRDLVSYDDFYYKRSLNVAGWWNNLWIHQEGETVTKTLVELFTGVCSYAGVTVSSATMAKVSTLPNASMTMTDAEVEQYSKITFEDVLHSICELMGVFPSINGDGELDLIQLDTSSHSFLLVSNINGTLTLKTTGSGMSISSSTFDVGNPDDVSMISNSDGTRTLSVSGDIESLLVENIEIANSHYEDYETDYINRIDVYLSSDDLYLSVGQGNNGYPVSGNLFLLAKADAAIRTICTNLLSAIGGIKYVPLSLKFVVADLDLDLGSRFNSDESISYILGQTYSGVQLIEQTISADAQGQSITQKASGVNNERVLRSGVNTVVTKTGTVTIYEVNSIVNEAVSHATQVITGGQGSYVFLVQDSNGYLTEICITDRPGIDDLGHPTADNIWRWNSGGLGFSSTGYEGTFGTAITNDGQIVADRITTGTLNAEVFNANSIYVNPNGSGNTIAQDMSDINYNLQSAITSLSGSINQTREELESALQASADATNKTITDFQNAFYLWQTGALFQSFYVDSDGVHIRFTSGNNTGEILMDGANIRFYINGALRSLINADGFNFDYGVITTALQIGKYGDGTATNASWVWTKSQSGHFRLVYKGA